MKFLFTLAVASMMSGCITILPKVDISHFRACEHLCKGNRGAAMIQSEIQVNYAGNITIMGEHCNCKNKMVFSIIGTAQDD